MSDLKRTSLRWTPENAVTRSVIDTYLNAPSMARRWGDELLRAYEVFGGSADRAVDLVLDQVKRKVKNELRSVGLDVPPIASPSRGPKPIADPREFGTVDERPNWGLVRKWRENHLDFLLSEGEEEEGEVIPAVGSSGPVFQILATMYGEYPIEGMTDENSWEYASQVVSITGDCYEHDGVRYLSFNWAPGVVGTVIPFSQLFTKERFESDFDGVLKEAEATFRKYALPKFMRYKDIRDARREKVILPEPGDPLDAMYEDEEHTASRPTGWRRHR